MKELKEHLESLKIDREVAPRRGRWAVVLLLLAAAAAGALYYASQAPALNATVIETVSASVQQTAEASPGTPLLTASGYVVARRKAVVSAKIQGRLAELRVEEGSQVREGEVIARLESGDYLAQVERARAEIQRAEADLAEARRQARISGDLARAKVASQDQYDAALSRVQLAEAAGAQARANLHYQQEMFENTLIKAPFSGVVVKKMAEVGESVAPIPPGVNLSTSSGAIVALADMATLEVEVDINEAQVSRLKSNQPADVLVQAFPDRHYRGVLRQIIPTADRTKATVMAKVTILDKDKDLKPEMSANATFLEQEKPRPGRTAAEAKPTVTVPKEALTTREGKSVVFEVAAGRVRQRPVTTGVERNGQVIVVQGLSGGETLVSRPPGSLRDGDPVKVKEQG